MAYLDKEKIKKSLTRDDIKKILVDLGSESCIDNGGNELYFKTVCHGGEKYKLCYYVNSQLFHCYTDCGDSFDIYELVLRSRRAKGINLTFLQAVKYVASITAHLFYSNIEETKSDKIDDWQWLNCIGKTKIKEKVNNDNKIISEHVLEMFCYLPHEAWIKDGITEESMQKYQISYWAVENKIIIPHRNIEGKLIGVRGRAFNKEDLEKGKYMPITVEGICLKHKLGNNLYGLCQNEEAIRRIGKIMLVESEKSVLLADGFYRQNNFTVAVCGSNLTDEQCRIILSLGVREVFIAFDKEYTDADSWEAEAYANKLINLAKKLNPYCTVYILWDKRGLLNKKDSPLDKGKDVLEELMKEKIEVDTDFDISIES